MPAIGGGPGNAEAAPMMPVESTTLGSTDSGMRNASSTSGDQPEASPRYMPVTAALDAAVTWRSPPERVHTIQLSTVPNANSPASHRRRSGSTMSKRKASLVADAFGATRM